MSHSRRRSGFESQLLLEQTIAALGFCRCPPTSYPRVKKWNRENSRESPYYEGCASSQFVSFKIKLSQTHTAKFIIKIKHFLLQKEYFYLKQMNECLVICGRDEIGKHRGFKIPWPRALWVRVPPPALLLIFYQIFVIIII